MISRKLIIAGLVLLVVLTTACGNYAENSNDISIDETEPDDMYSDFSFSLTDTQDSFRLDNYYGDEEYIVVPSEYAGLPVTIIDTFAFSFSHESRVKQITIADTVTHIESFAFSGCDNLETIIVPNTVEYFGWGCFGCDSLKTIEYRGDLSESGYTLSEWYSDFAVPSTCVITELDADGETMVWEYSDLESDDIQSIKITEMKNNYPYILEDGVIKQLDTIGYTSEYYAKNSISEIPVISSDKQIIVRTENDLSENITLYPISFSFEYYINPLVRFWYLDDELVMQSEIRGGYSYLNELNEMVTVDSIDGISVESMTDLPFKKGDYGWVGYNYYLCSLNEPKTFSVGYWIGTNYKKMELSTVYIPYTMDVEHGYSCSYIKTREGYFILDISSLPSGYYFMRGFNSNLYQTIYIE